MAEGWLGHTTQLIVTYDLSGRSGGGDCWGRNNLNIGPTDKRIHSVAFRHGDLACQYYGELDHDIPFFGYLGTPL